MQKIHFFLFIISSLGYLFYFVRNLNIRPLLSSLVWVSFTVVSVYGFAILGVLKVGAYIVLTIGVFLGLAAIYKQISNKKTINTGWLFLLILVLPLLIIYLSPPSDFLFLAWDEVGGWAKTQKIIFDTNALLNQNSPVSLRSYPPGQQIFQYFFTLFAGWTEKNILIAQNIYLICGMLAVTGSLITKPLWAVLVYLSLFPLIYFFQFDYTTIYSDPLLAVVFAACLALAIKPRERFMDDVVLAICLCGFVLLKDIALVFSSLIIAIYFLNVFNQYSLQPQKTELTKYLLSMRSILICSLSIVAVLISWKWYVSVIGTEKLGFTPVTLNSWMQEPYRTRAGLTMTNFIFAVIKPGFFVANPKYLAISLSLVQVMGIIGSMGLLVVCLVPKRMRTTSFLIVLAMAAGALAYLFFLLWLYLTYFTEYEGTRLASFERYAMTYLLAWFLVSYACLMGVISNIKKPYLWVIPILGLVIIYTAVPSKFYSDSWQIQLNPVALDQRKKTQALSDQVRLHIKSGEKVYFLAQNSNGYERHLFDYAMLPYPPNDCWSVGQKYNEGDVWTCNRPLESLLNGYNYLAIYNADARFWSDNRKLFAAEGQDRQTGVYKITKNSDGISKLFPVN